MAKTTTIRFRHVWKPADYESIEVMYEHTEEDPEDGDLDTVLAEAGEFFVAAAEQAFEQHEDLRPVKKKSATRRGR